MKKRIYLDNNATTEPDEAVLAALGEAFKVFGNPSSSHYFGQEAKHILVKARDMIAQYFNVLPQEVIFTSGATEGLNMCMRGFFGFYPKGHLITSSCEHAAVYETANCLKEAGLPVTFLNPGVWGAVSPQQVLESIRPDTNLIVLMAANSETGVKTDYEAIAEIAATRKIAFVVDGVQLLGKEPFSLPRGVSAISFSAHKIHGPKGIGFTIIRKGFRLAPFISGGNQEFGKRAGTENVAAIAGLAKAIELLSDQKVYTLKMATLRDHFEKELISLGGVSVNGEGSRIANTSNLAFEGIEGEVLLLKLDLEGLAASHGSACSTGALEPSRVLLNMGYSKERAGSSVRFSLCRHTEKEEIERAISIIKKILKKLR